MRSSCCDQGTCFATMDIYVELSNPACVHQSRPLRQNHRYVNWEITLTAFEFTTTALKSIVDTDTIYPLMTIHTGKIASRFLVECANGQEETAGSLSTSADWGRRKVIYTSTLHKTQGYTITSIHSNICFLINTHLHIAYYLFLMFHCRFS